MKTSTTIRHRLHVPLVLCALLATNAAFGANGLDTWSGVFGSGNWADANWTGANNPPIAGDSLAFDVTVGTSGGFVTNNFATTTNFNGLTFNAGAVSYSLYGIGFTNTGGLTDNSPNPQNINLPIILGLTTNIAVANGGSLTISNTISGAFGFTNSGAGLLTLAYTNTLTGPITVANGTLTIAPTGWLDAGTYAGAISNAATGAFNLNGTNTQTLSGTINNGGALSFNGGPGTLTLSGAIANNGTGVISLKAVGTQNVTGAVTNAGTITFNTASASTLSGVLTGAGALNQSGTGTLTISGSSPAFAGSVSGNAGEVISPTGSSLGGSVTVASGATNAVAVNSAGGVAIIGSLTYNVAGANVLFNFAQSPASVAPLLVTNLTFTSTPNVIVSGNVALPPGQYPLIKCVGTLPGTLPTSLTITIVGVNGAGCSLVKNTPNNSIDLLVPAGAGNQLAWATGSGVWDINTTANWLNGTTPSKYGDGDFVIFPDSVSAGSTNIVTLNTTVSPGSMLFNDNVDNYVFAGSGSIAGSGGLTKEGAGLLDITNNETYTGPTVVDFGTLTLDFSEGATTVLSPNSALTLAGGTLNVIGDGNAVVPSLQAFTNTTITGASSVLNVAPASGTQEISNTVALGALTLGPGGTVMFVGPAYSSGPSTTSGQSGAINNSSSAGFVTATAKITTTSGTVNDQLTGPGAVGGVAETSGLAAGAAFATVGLYDFAIVVGPSPYTIIGASQGTTQAGGVTGGDNLNGTDGAYTLVYTAGQLGGSGGNTGGTADVVGPAVAGRNTDEWWGVRFNSPGPVTFTASGTETFGGVLVTPNVGANNVIMGTYSSYRQTTGPGETVFWQNNTAGMVIFNGALADNSEGGADSGSVYVQAGPGLVDFTVANTYNGPSYLNGGVTEIVSDAGLGTANTNATLFLNGGSVLAGASFALDNGGGLKRAVVLGFAGGGLAALTNDTMTVDGVLSGSAASGALWIGIPPTSANGNVAGLPPGEGPGTANAVFTNAVGTVVLSGTNSYTTGTMLYSGALNFTSNSLGTGGITFNGGTLQWAAGTTYDVSAQTVTVGSAGGRLDLNGSSVTLANPIGNSGSGGLTLTNGTLTLPVANTFAGGMTVGTGSTLVVNNTSGSATGSGPVIVQSGGTLTGTGTVGGALTVNSGGILNLPNSGSGTLTVGALTVSAGAVFNVNFASSTVNDSIVVTQPNGLQLSPTGAFSLFVAGSPATFAAAGTYNLVQYSGIIGGQGLDSSWTTISANNPHVANALPGWVYSFGTSGGYLTLTIAVNPSVVAGVWTGPSGNWSTAGDWSSSPAFPQLAGSAATFGFGSSLTTVTLTAPESAGFLSFTNGNSFVISGASVLTLNNNGAGAKMNVSGGSANVISAPLSLGDTVAFTLGANDVLTISGNIGNASGPETISLTGTGTLALTGNNTYGPSAGSFGTILNTGSLLQAGSSTALGAGDVSFAASATLQAGTTPLTLANNIDIAPGANGTIDSQANTLTLNGAISDSGSLVKIGTGTLTLGGVNGYAGGTTIKAGEIIITADYNLGLANPLSLIGGGLRAGSGSVVLNLARNVFIGAAGSGVVTNGYLDAAAGASLTVPGTIGNPPANSAANNLLVNSFAGSSGIVYLEGPGSFTGATTIPNGVLWLLGNANGTPTTANLSLQSSTVTVNNGSGALVFDTSMNAATLGGITGTATVYLTNSTGSPVTLTVGNNNANTTFSGGFNDVGAVGLFVKAGTGNLTLTGTNTYLGLTTVNAGTLVISNGGILNVGALAGGGYVVNGGLLTNSSTITSGLANVASALVETAGTINVGPLDNVNNNDGMSMQIYGGTLIAPDLNLGRDNSYAAPGLPTPTAALTTVGLYIDSTNTLQPANVTLGSLEIADAHGANSSDSARMDAGTLTVNGEIEVGHQATAGRWSIFQVNGGIFTNSDTVNGIVLGNSASAANSAEVLFSGGSNYVQLINFGTGSDTTAGIGDLFITNSTLYVGSGGINVASATGTYVPAIFLERGTLGALANWSSSISPNGANTGWQLPIATNFVIQAADPSGTPWSITLNNGIAGVGGITKTGSGTLFLSGTNSYTGSTIISNGILSLTNAPNTVVFASPAITVELGATFDVSSVSGFTVGASSAQSLQGYGANNGSVTIGTAGSLYAGVAGTYGTNTFNNNLTLSPGAAANISLGTVAQNSSNGLFVVSGNLTLNGNSISIAAPATTANLDLTHDYVLFSVTGTLTGAPLTTPVWSVKPANATNFVVITNTQNQVVLHAYAASSLPPTAAGSINPSTLYIGQSGVVTVIVTNGTSSSTINSVVLNLVAIGGTTSSLTLSNTINSGAGSVWTNTLVIPNNNLAGSYTLTATITDANNEVAVVPISLFVAPGKFWTGAGTPTANWSDTANWLGNLAPGINTGDSVTFAGTVNLSPLMDNPYGLLGVTFYPGAGAFNLTTASGNVLSLAGGITNTAGGPQTISLPITATAPVAFNAVSNDLVFQPTGSAYGINNGGFVVTFTGTHNTTVNDIISDTGLLPATGGLAKSGTGTNFLFGVNTYTGNTTISAGTLTIGTSGQLNSGAYAGAIVDNGTFNYSSGQLQTFSGVISGSGAVNFIGGGNTSGAIVTLSGASTFTGNVTISNTYVSDLNQNLGNPPASSGLGNPATAGRTVTINNNGTLSLDNAAGTSPGNEFGAGAYNPPLAFIVNQGGVMQITDGNASIGPVTLNGGTLIANSAGGGSLEYMAFELGGSVTVSSNGPALITNTLGGGAFAGLNLGISVTTGNTTFVVSNTGSAGPDLAIGVPLADAGGEAVGASVTGLTKTGAGRLYLSGTNVYHGATTISNGTLILGVANTNMNTSSVTTEFGTIFDVSSMSSPNFTVGGVTAQSLQGYGTNNGSVIIGPLGSLFAGVSAAYGTNTFNNNLTLASGASANIALGTVAKSSSNGLFVVTGNLTLNANSIHITAPATTSNLDTTTDYILFTNISGTITGTAATTPIWAVKPANAANFYVLTKNNSVVLHNYGAGSLPPTAGGAIAPANLISGQTGTVTVTITNGGSSTISSVVLNESAIGLTTEGLTQLSSSGTGSIWTGPVTVPAAGGLQGSYLLSATVTDGAGEQAVVTFSLNVVPGKLWTGSGNPTPNWSDNANWLGSVAPNPAGDSVIFDGSLNTSPQMDNAYAIVAMTFDATASAFNVGSTGNTMTLSGGITNNSPFSQTIGIPITASAAVTFNAASNNLVFTPTQNLYLIDNGGFTLTVTGSSNTIISNIVADTGGLTKSGTGTSTLYGANLYSGGTIISAGTLIYGTGSQLDNGAYTATIANGGTLDYFGGLPETFSGVISGAGAFNITGGGTNSGAIVTLSAANTFTGNLVISNTWVSDTIADNVAGPTSGGLGNPQTAGRTVTINNNAILSLDAPGGNDFGNGASAPALGFIINQGGVMQITAGNATVGPLTFNGGTLDCTPSALALEYEPIELGSTVTVGGTSPSLITNTSDATNGGLNLGVNVTTGQTTFNVGSTGAAGADLTVAVPLADGGGVVTSTRGLIKTGLGTMALDDTNLYHGSTTLSNGVLVLGSVEQPGLGGPLGISASSNPGSIVFNGGILRYSTVNNNDYSGRFSVAVGQAVNIDTANQTVTFATALTSSGGTLTKLGLGRLTLNNGANTYSGATTISNGILALASGTSIPDSTNIVIAAGGTLDVSAQSTFTLAPTATLTASGTATAASIAGGTTVSLASRPITLNYDGSHPALTISSGTLSLNGNAFIVNGSSQLPTGSYIIVTQAVGNITSSGTYTVTGTAINSADQATITVSGSTVTLNISVTSAPSITFTVSGNNAALNLSWSSAYLGSSLLYQSNAVGTGLKTNSSAWLVWPGSTTVTSEVIPIGTTNEIFFQLLFP